MHQNIDLIELLRALNAEAAEYLIVGGYAFAFHGRPRATKNIDLYIGCDPGNARRVWKALVAFGAPLADLTEAGVASPDTYFIMGRPPNQIDVITSIDGVLFADAWPNRIESTYDGVCVCDGPYRNAAAAHAKMMEVGHQGSIPAQPGVVAKTIVQAVQSRKPKTRYVTGGFAGTMLFMRRVLSDRAFDATFRMIERQTAKS